MRHFRCIVVLLLLLLIASCSKDISPVSYHPREPLTPSVRYQAYNAPVNEIGAGFGVANLNARFTGVSQKSFNDRTGHYLEDMRFAWGGFYRYGISQDFGLHLGADFLGFSGEFGLDEHNRIPYRNSMPVHSGENGLPGDGGEDNFFEGPGRQEGGVSQTGGFVERFENGMFTVSVYPYYYLPLFRGVPLREANARRLYVFGGLSMSLINPTIYNTENEVIQKDDTEEALSPSVFGMSFPLGAGFSWRLSERLSLAYDFGYHFSWSNHATGIIDPQNHYDRYFTNRISIGYRIN